MNALHRPATRLVTTLAAILLIGCSSAPGQVASQAANPTAAPTVVPPTAAAAPTEFPNDLPLVAGQYVLSAEAYYGVPPLAITFTVPSDRWGSWGPGLATDESDVLANVGVAFHDLANLYLDACRWASAGLRDPAVGPTVDDLVTALASVPHTRASEATDVELAGYSGRYIELTIEDDLKFAGCDQGEVHIWTTPQRWSRYYQGPGQIERFWVLDVEGTRLVIEASLFPSASTAYRDELQQILDSIEIAR